MEPTQVIEFLFYGAMTLIGAYLSTTIAKLRESVEKLNIVLASEIVKIAGAQESILKLENEIEKMSNRVSQLEMKTYSCPNGNKHCK